MTETRHLFPHTGKPCVMCHHVMRHTLNDVMEFDHVIRVHDNGSVTELRDVYAPELPPIGEGDDMLNLAARDHGWELLRGWTGQHGYNGPVMHASEYVGGRIERHILATPGLYVTVALDDDYDEPGQGGWVVAYIDAEHGCEACHKANDTVRLGADPVTGAHRWLCRACFDTRTRLAVQSEATARLPWTGRRCEELARRGTDMGPCDRPLDAHGNCDRASQHIHSK